MFEEGNKLVYNMESTNRESGCGRDYWEQHHRGEWQGESGYMSHHSFASSGDSSGMKVKLLCSCNGKIIPRPSDRKLRYVGGNTRILSVHRYITYADIMVKIMEVYGQHLLLKYQLPDEEIDSLISVSSDEDLENMMDEYDRLDPREGFPRLRVFLFSEADFDALHLNDIADPKTSERRYVEAVNGVEETSLQSVVEPTGASKDLLGLNFNEALDPLQFSGTVSVAVHASTSIPMVIASVVQSAPTVPSFPAKQSLEKTSSGYQIATSPQLLSRSNQDKHDGSLFSGGISHQVENSMNGIAIASLQPWQDQDLDYMFKLQDGLSLSAVDNHTLSQNVNRGGLSCVEPQEKLIKMKDHIELPLHADDRSLGSYSDSSVPIASQQWLQIPEASWQHHLDIVSDVGHGINIWHDAHLDKGNAQKHFGQQNLNGSSTLHWQLEQHPHQQQTMVGGDMWVKLTSSDSSSLTTTPALFPSHIERGGNYKEHIPYQHSSGESKHTSYHGMIGGQHISESVTSISGYDELPITEEQHIQAHFLGQQNLVQEQLSVPSFRSGHQPQYTEFPSYEGRVAGLHDQQEVRRQFDLEGQQILSVPSRSSGVELQGQQFAPHPCYHNEKKEIDLILEERNNELVESRACRGELTRVGQKISAEHGFITENSVVASGAEVMSTNFPGLNIGSNCLQPKSNFLPFDLERNSQCIEGPVFLDNLQTSYSMAKSASRFPTETTLGEESLVFESEIAFKEGLSFSSNRGASTYSSPSIPNTSERPRDYVADIFKQTTHNLAEIVLEPSMAKSMPSSGYDNLMAGFNSSSLFAVPITSSSTLAEPVVNLASGSTLPSTTTDLQFEQYKMPEDTVILSGGPEPGDDGHMHVDSHGYKEGKSTIEHGSENAVAIGCQSTLYSTPTFSIENWVKELRQSGLEEQAAQDFQHEEKITESQLDAEADREMVFDDFNNLGIIEDDKVEHKVEEPRNAATIAEEEAVRRGLQIIKYVDLEELRELGSGTFGTVYHGKWRGTDVAIKRIKSSCFTGRPPDRERLIADFWQEACILGRLHHPNVVAFYGIVPDGPGGTLATVTEYMVNGSLKQVLHKKDRSIDQRKRLLIAMDAAFGMEYLHGKKIVHFDLKGENLLVNMRDPQRPICKVADLGLSKVKHQTMVSGGVRGTLPWMAPELLNGSSSLVSEKVDIFSFGVVMWELLTGEEPYANMHYGAIIGGIVNNTLRPQVPNWCDTPWRLLMERCWSAEPNERPGFTEIAAELRAMAASLNEKALGQAHRYGQKGHN